MYQIEITNKSKKRQIFMVFGGRLGSRRLRGANWLVAACAAVLLFGNAAVADPVPVLLNCNGDNYGPALIVACPTLGGSAGLVNGANATSSGATTNSFLTTVSPGTLNTTVGYGGITSKNPPPNDDVTVGPVTAVTQWNAPQATVSLTLQGTVLFPALYTSITNDSAIILDLEGEFSGGIVDTPTLSNINGGAGVVDCSNIFELCIEDTINSFDSFGNAQCQLSACSFSITETALYYPPGPLPSTVTETETLEISTFGGVIYTNDDPFEGEGVPEPASLALFAPGLFALFVIRRRKVAPPS